MGLEGHLGNWSGGGGGGGGDDGICGSGDGRDPRLRGGGGDFYGVGRHLHRRGAGLPFLYPRLCLHVGWTGMILI